MASGQSTASCRVYLVIVSWNLNCYEASWPFRFAIMTVLLWGMLQPAFVHAETTFIPSAVASGRYDSNIYFAPSSVLPPGTDTRDFAGTVGGGVQLLHKSRDVEASFTGGADFNFYAINTPLNFVTTRVDSYVILDRWIERLAKGARLTVGENFRYTPESPGFLSGGKGPVVDDPFLRGIQTFRANTFSTTTSVNGLYPVFKALALQGDYAFSILRVGSILVLTTTGAPTFFDTTVHNWSAGPNLALTREDRISLLYRQRLISQEITTGGGQSINTNTQSLSANYTRVMPDWNFNLEGGATLVEPASQWFPTASLRFSTNPERSTTVELVGSRQAAPSFFFVAGALISNVGQVQITHRASERLTLGGSVSYALNQLATDTSLTFQNLTAAAGLNYKLTRTIAVDLFYSYTNLNNGFTTPGYQISRNVVGFALTAQWK